MISKDDLDLLVHGAASRAAYSIESVAGRKLTRSELDALTAVFAQFGGMVAASCAAARVPPPPPAPRPQGRTQWFSPVATQEIRQVTDEDIKRAKEKG